MAMLLLHVADPDWKPPHWKYLSKAKEQQYKSVVMRMWHEAFPDGYETELLQ
eukprot:CAMPEP_0119103614 /NCGR_PEP_ID=MMETSP1180-20130426/2021_1 /TAXON_ID=3052 ORGANISM="Chlamydomonas cf sp, Strain CCMP681" /NCGR_SAMPLE_ID=MMETSP1180 /ASSEMBLY_ACC=CAM_ASM_000741 /LENGTH=51 /DNA_ID=CAMNT_0007088167 /DNA_START=614 /DNA_END=769 /DNA_ORIENTATION=+